MTRPERSFRFEPRGLGRHYLAAVCNVHYLLHRDGIQGQSRPHLSAVHAALQLAEAAQAADEVYALVRAQVFYAEDLVEYEAARYVHVEHSDRV